MAKTINYECGDVKMENSIKLTEGGGGGNRQVTEGR